MNRNLKDEIIKCLAGIRKLLADLVGTDGEDVRSGIADLLKILEDDHSGDDSDERKS